MHRRTRPASPRHRCANSAGKSNLLDALRFLHGIGQGWPIRDVVSGRVQGGTRIWNGIRGGTKEIVRFGAASFRIRSDWQILGDSYLHELVADGLNVHTESVGNLFHATRINHATPAERDLQVTWLPGSMRDPKEATVFEPSSSSAITSPTAAANAFARHLAPTLGSIRFLDLQPDAMRDYSEKSNAAQLADDGSNLSSVLWTACQHEGRRRELVDWLVELCGIEIAVPAALKLIHPPL